MTPSEPPAVPRSASDLGGDVAAAPGVEALRNIGEVVVKRLASGTGEGEVPPAVSGEVADWTNESDLSSAVQDLISTLERVGPQLRGAWVLSRRPYEVEVAKRLGADVVASRHWDCVMRSSSLRVELKKTSTGGMWFDLVRYGEAVLAPALGHDVITVVLRYKQAVPEITEVALITHEVLTGALGVDEKMAHAIAELNKRVPFSLNAQARLTRNRINEIAFKVITWPASVGEPGSP